MDIQTASYIGLIHTGAVNDISNALAVKEGGAILSCGGGLLELFFK